MSTKKAYKKPSLTKVELRPDEAVLTACKLPAGQAATLDNAAAIEMCLYRRKLTKDRGLAGW